MICDTFAWMNNNENMWGLCQFVLIHVTEKISSYYFNEN